MKQAYFTDVISENIFKETKNWSPKDWEQFRKKYYKNYFDEKDNLTSAINRKDPYCFENMYFFKKDRLEKIKEYNKCNTN